MRQEEEWEQVIQGLWGPGQAQVSVRAEGIWGGESRAGRQSPAPLFPWWTLELSTSHCGIATGHGLGEHRLCSGLQGVVKR